MKFLEAGRVICPSCQSVAVGFIDSDPKSAIHPMPSRPTEGRLAIVTDAGRDAMDASGATDEGAILWTAKSCGPDIPTLVSSSRKEIFAGDGGKKARLAGESTK